MRVWQLYPRSDETLWYFNSHTREGVTVCCLNKLFSSLFQLTHPWGCDKKRAVWCSKLQAISTHTPVRVWRRRKEACGGWGYFNSHTREGVTETCLFHAFRHWIFQLTHPWGCDSTPKQISEKSMKFQLTHPWGCDSASVICWSNTNGFQLTHPWGCDKFDILGLKTMEFQLTHPWGCDLYDISHGRGLPHFNSHTREGVTDKGR